METWYEMLCVLCMVCVWDILFRYASYRTIHRQINSIRFNWLHPLYKDFCTNCKWPICRYYRFNWYRKYTCSIYSTGPQKTILLHYKSITPVYSFHQPAFQPRTVRWFVRWSNSGQQKYEESGHGPSTTGNNDGIILINDRKVNHR